MIIIKEWIYNIKTTFPIEITLLWAAVVGKLINDVDSNCVIVSSNCCGFVIDFLLIKTYLVPKAPLFWSVILRFIVSPITVEPKLTTFDVTESFQKF